MTVNPSRTSKINGPATCHDPLMRNMPGVNVKVVDAVEAQLGEEPTPRGSSEEAHSLGGSERASFHNAL